MAPSTKPCIEHSEPSLGPLATLRKKPAKMAHLHLKRFADTDDLTPGARRNRAEHPADVIVDLAPTGRAVCKQCGELIPKGSVRFVLMLQCHKGYKMSAPVHGENPNCFAVHIESTNLTSREEACVKEDVLGKENARYAWREIESVIAKSSEVKVEDNTIREIPEPKSEV